MNQALATVVLLAAATLLPAQKAGEPAADFAFGTSFNFGKIKAKKLSELRGAAVLLEFWGVH